MTDGPLRFCMVTTFYPPFNFGGDGVFVHRLANALAQRGHQVDVIHCIDAYRLLAGRMPDGSYSNHPNVTIHGLKSPLGFLSPLATHQLGRPFIKAGRIKAILARGFDVIHYHNVSLVGGPKVLEYGQGIKLYTMHEYWLVCPTHVLFKFNRAVCTQPQCFRCTLRYGRPPQWWRYFGLTGRAVEHIDAFIAPSQHTKDTHLAMGLDAPIVHLPNFVPDPGDVEPASDGSVTAKPYFLFVGRLEKIKGLQTLLPVFRDHRKAQLLVAGSGRYERELRRLAGDSRNIRFLGQQSEREMQALYQGSVAVIVPSVGYETFGQVVVEAFARKVPAIVRELGGVAEVVNQSEAGYVYRTEAELVAAVDRLLDDPEHRRELGERGYTAYQRNWSTEAHLRQYFALIRELKSGGSSRFGGISVSS